MSNNQIFVNARRGLMAGGNWIVDHVKMIDTWPAQDALATIGGQSQGNGGGPYNVLKDLAKLGCGFPLEGVGLIGKDADGEAILRDCDAHGIRRLQLHQTGQAPTSYTDVMTVADSGRRTFFHQHGANALLSGAHFDLAQTDARIFYLGYLCLLRGLDCVDPEGRTPASRLLEQARELGLVTVVDLVSNETSDFAAIVDPSLPHVDYLFLNEYELARLVGGEVRRQPAPLERQARKVLERGVHQGVVVHLPELAMCVLRGQPVVIQPAVRVPREQIVGTAVAGDAFAAGFLLGLQEAWPLQRCLELGVCVAAASLRDATCSAAVEPWQTCMAWGNRHGFNPLPGR